MFIWFSSTFTSKWKFSSGCFLYVINRFPSSKLWKTKTDVKQIPTQRFLLTGSVGGAVIPGGASKGPTAAPVFDECQLPFYVDSFGIFARLVKIRHHTATTSSLAGASVIIGSTDTCCIIMSSCICLLCLPIVCFYAALTHWAMDEAPRVAGHVWAELRSFRALFLPFSLNWIII